MSNPVPVGDQFQVNTYHTNSIQSLPTIAMDADGDFIVSWTSNGQDGSGEGKNIYAQRYNREGVAQGSEFRVNTYTNGDQLNSTIAMDANGDFVVSWTSYYQDGSGYGIYAQKYNSAGVAQGGEFKVNTYTTGYQQIPTIAMDADGDFIVSWTSYYQDGSRGGIYAQRYNREGVAQGSEFQVNTYTNGNQSGSSIAMDADGDFVVSWTSRLPNGSDLGFGIYAQRYNREGVAQGSEFQVNTYTNGNQFDPTIAMDADGDFVVSWTSFGQDGSDSGIYAQRYNREGVAQGVEFQVNTYTNNRQNAPSIAMDADGDFVISWISRGQDGSEYGIYAQCYNREGVAQGGEFQVNTYTNGNQSLPSIAMDADGDFVISWQGYGIYNSYGIYAQRFSSSSLVYNEINGTIANDTLNATANSDRISANEGNDTVNSTVANAQQNDTFDGGLGSDTLVMSGGDASTNLVLNVTNVSNQLTGIDNLTVQNFEIFDFSNFNGTLRATGGAGNDRIISGAGNDLLDGRAGRDTMTGGLGNDLYYVDNVGDVVVESSTLASEFDRVASTVSYTLGANVEALYLQGTGAINGTGNALNNTIVGNRANNVINGRAGRDTMTGGLGNDLYYVDNLGDVVSETSTIASEFDRVASTVSYTLGANVEALYLQGTGAINGTGNNLNNTIVGNRANNILNGGLGRDTMTGGLGNDLYYVDNLGDVVSETSTIASEFDRVASTVSYTLGANVEALYLQGTGAINGTGNALNNTIVGNQANNILNGGLGADTMIGGLGNDLYYVDNVSDVVTETSTLASEIDRVASTVSYTLGANVEALYLQGTGAINGTGNALNNTIVGNSANNTLNGSAGNDSLIGGLGNDILVGGSGNDALTGGAGNDIFRFNNKNEGIDAIADFTTGSDILQISASGFGGGLVAGTLGAQQILIGSGATAANSASQRFIYNTTNGSLFFDADGSGSGSAVQIATLSNKAAITNNDFLLIV